MTGFVDIAEILGGKHDGEDVKIRGWLYNSRSSGSIVFLQIRDGTGVLQCTVNKKNVDEATFNNLEKLQMESTLELKGKVRVDQRAPGGYELSANNLGTVYEAMPDFPITKKEHGLEFLLDNRHLSIRDPRLQMVFKIKAQFMRSAREWFWENGYTETQSPSFTSAA
ncbi:TPA: asparagine--tRNA ligase, partial [Candidatus Bathyarchaeota archaeon]|nr:asparagine--tRNA ligase [Candidatus Bathyarchaeota archaeon]